MTGFTAPLVREAHSDGRPTRPREWLEAFANGVCDRNSFVQAVTTLFEGSPEPAWEMWSLLDQYHRLGKIDTALYHALKSRFRGQVTEAESLAHAAADKHDAEAHTPTVPLGDGPHPPAGRAKAAHPRPPVEPPVVGDTLRGRYHLQAVLGRGGMGTVFEASDDYRVGLPGSGARLAIKVLHTEVTERPDLLSELQREFRHAQMLSHPNIVRVHEFDRDGDVAFFTMELLQGHALSRVLSARGERPLARPIALAIIRDMGAALAHAHSRDVIHGDLNPQNVFITRDGEVRVLDFGASHMLIGAPWISEPDAQRSPVGTPGYASCELLEGQGPDLRDDLYAFACVAYLLFAGVHPFKGKSAIEAREQKLQPRRPPKITQGQWRALRAGLEFKRERRPSNVNAWLERMDLRAAVPNMPALSALVTPPPERGAYTNIVLAGVLIVTLATFLWVRNKGPALLAGTPWNFASGISTGIDDGLDRLQEFITNTAARFARGADASEPVANADTTASGVQQAAPRALPSGPTPALPQAPRSPPTTIAASAPVAVPAAQQTAAAAAPAVSAVSAVPAVPATDAASLGFTADTFVVSPLDSIARVTVKRSGNLRGNASFVWWTEEDSAKADADFAAFGPGKERIAAGQEFVRLAVPLVSDPARRGAKTFYVVIGSPSSGTSLGARSRAEVVIPARD